MAVDFDKVQEKISQEFNRYGNERDWAKMRPDEMAGIAIAVVVDAWMVEKAAAASSGESEPMYFLKGKTGPKSDTVYLWDARALHFVEAPAVEDARDEMIDRLENLVERAEYVAERLERLDERLAYLPREIQTAADRAFSAASSVSEAAGSLDMATRRL